MKTQNMIMIVVIVLIGITACKSSKKAQPNDLKSTADNSMTSIDWPGTYQGILPCADCEGIKTRIVLNKDLNYILEIQYLGKDEKIFQSKGTFKWDESGSKITLDNENKQIYQVGENRIFHLDKDANRITGEISNNYILEMEKTELTGKYWKLVKLNGKPVETGEREAFIRFDAEDKRVHGNSSCNMFNGKYELPEGNRIKFTPFAMTKMACIGNNIESEFIKALGKTTNYSLTSNELILQDEFETTLAKFESDFFK
ncbi:MAG: copper resistance protein NlpE N-terminal domain-containing protein [Draconibacterium sp.]|nr:copper resistance protein NlpE N-terminal domain-containing protein [Draconibacterium sp.]